MFGRRAGIAAANYALGHDFVDMADPAGMVVGWVGDILSEHGNERVADIRGALQQSMDNNAAVFRTEETLKQALTDIHDQGALRQSPCTTRANASTATCWRPSSWASCWNSRRRRGGRAEPQGIPRRHAREDYPNRDDTNYMRHTMAYKQGTDLLSDILLDYKPVVQTRYEPMERKY